MIQTLPTARDIVTHRMAAQARRFPELDLRPLDTAALERRDPRDAALAHAIDQAVARRWLTLVPIIQHGLTRPWTELQPPVQAALLTGAAQLLLMDRLPDHAVIHEAVEWTKHHGGAPAAGLVNAVLRRVAGLRSEMVPAGARSPEASPDVIWQRHELPLDDGRIRTLTEPVFAEHPLRRLAAQTGHSDWLIARWTKAHGEKRTRELAAHSLVHPPILMTGLDAAAANRAGSGVLEPHDESGFFVFNGEHGQMLALLREHPEARVQDPGSAAAIARVRALDPAFQPGLIVDVCAGQGTKTRQMAAAWPRARIIAGDNSDERRGVLRQVFAGHDRVRIVEPSELRRFDAQAELLVLDVPCSNTAVLPRRPEAKYRLGEESLTQLVNMQRQIIADSIPLLAPRGRMLYVTCSLEAAENQLQAAWVTRWHRLTTAAEELRATHGRPGGEARAYSDGGYFALLKRG